MIRWGILGVANIAVKRVIAGIQASNNGHVAAIASRNFDRARAAAQTFDISEAFGSYEQMLQHDGIDAVYIPLPHHLHRDWTVRAAQAGKHVLCEKPLALNVEEAREMVATCEEAGVLLMEALMYRFHPAWVEVRHLVEGGSIGALRSVHTEFAYFLDDPASFRSQPSLGGGALMDLGCYAVDASRMMFQREPAVIAASVLKHPVNQTDMVSSALLDFGSGHATFTVGTQIQRGQSVHLAGTKARIEVATPFNIPADQSAQVRVIRGGSPGVAPDVEILEFGPADVYTLEAQAFGRAVLGESPLPISLDDSIAGLAVLQGIINAIHY
jgi:predicted dehydrogenase